MSARRSPCRRPRAPLGAALAALLAACAASPTAPAFAFTKLEGEYQLMLDIRKDQRFFPWDWDSNNDDNYAGAQLRMFSQPRAGLEAFVKVEADWKTGTPSNSAGSRPEFKYRESHLRYRIERGDRGFDSYLFSRQERFGIENRLIKVIENERIKDDFNGANAQGVRFDTWGYGKFFTSWIASDFSSQSLGRTDDAYVGRVRRDFLARDALRLGATYTRRETDRASLAAEGARVLALDSRYTWPGVRFGPLDLRNMDFSLEYAESRSSRRASDLAYPEAVPRKLTIFKDSTGLALPSRAIILAELRTMRLGHDRVGYLNFSPTWWNRGALYENRLGDVNRDEFFTERQSDNYGFSLNTYYLLPDRAITYTNNFKRYSSVANEKRSFREYYNELYIEFVNGFTGKTYLRQREVRQGVGDAVRVENYDDLFGEVQVESKLAWFRVQGKIKDLGRPTRRELYSAEMRVNLTDKTKMYNRFTFTNQALTLSKSVFLQLQFRPTGNVEAFLEYGPGWIGDSNNPVDDYDVENGTNQADLVKFVLKGTF